MKSFEEISTIVKVLEDKGFKYVEEFTLDDIYMKKMIKLMNLHLKMEKLQIH